MQELKTKKQFKEAIDYIKESKSYIYSGMMIFLISGIFGFFFRENLRFIDNLLTEILKKTLNLNMPEMVFFIMQNNIQSALISILAGIFLGIFPIINAIMNGAVVGYVLGLVYDIAGFGEWWRLIPHGIFELPAIFISLGLGIKLGFTIFLKKKNKEFKRRIYNSINVFLMIILPLLIIAGLIEGILIALAI